MTITYATAKLESEFKDARLLLRNRGKNQADKIKLRLDSMIGADHLGILRPPTPGKFHPLHENKAGLIACHLDEPYRLIFEPDHNPLPMLAAGGLDWNQVTRVKILGVLNYHERNKSKPA